MKYLRILPILILLVVTLAALLVWHDQNSGTNSNHLTKVRLAMDWTPNTNHTGIYVAQAKDWYAKHGIALEILPYSESVAPNSLVLSHKADVGIASTEDIVGETAKNHPLVSIGAIMQHNTSGFITRADSGISRPRDLDGKVFGGYGSPNENAVVSHVIKRDGGTGDFKNVTLSVQSMQALESKKIDFVWAFAGWEIILAKHDGMKTKFFPITSYNIPDSPTLSFAATPQTIQQQSDMLERFMSATAEGYEYARSHPHEAASLMMAGLPKATFPDKEMVYDSQNFLSAHYADKGRKWGVQDLSSWTGYPKFMLSSGVITDQFDKTVTSLAYDKLFTNQFVQ